MVRFGAPIDEDGVDGVQVGVVGELLRHLGRQRGLRGQRLGVRHVRALPQIANGPVVLHELDLLRVRQGEERHWISAGFYHSTRQPHHGVVVEPEMQLRAER
jgi:hypothetical protein